MKTSAMKNLNRVFGKSHALLKPPSQMSVSQWASENRYLSTEASAEAGLWRNERTPYLVEVMDSFSDPRIKHIVMVAASQVGKSEVECNLIGYIIDQDPSSILFIHPTLGEAKDFSKLRIAPMIRDCPALKSKVKEAKSRDSGNTILQKSFPGGILTMTGSTEAHALASKPVRYVFGDERDRWAVSAGKEGDPWMLAMARQKTFYNAVSVEVSTPTIRDLSPIADSYQTGTMEKWKSKCPCCGQYHEITWQDIRFSYDEIEKNRKKTYLVKRVWYICPGCGFETTEERMKAQPAHWEADNPEAIRNGTRSFWLNAFVSPWTSWESIIIEFLQAQGNPLKMQVVYNTQFGWLWENRGDIESEDTMLARREDYPAELPEGVLVLTAGVDTQDDRMEYEIVGHGMFGETWGIEKGIVLGKPNEQSTWDELDERVFNRKLSFESGVKLRVSWSFVDEGGHYTQSVRQQCQKRVARRVFAIKGLFGQDRPYTSPPKKMNIVINKVIVGQCWQYQLGVDSGKTQIMTNLKVQAPGANYCHFPRRDDYGPAYFTSLLSERLVFNPNRIRNPWEWKKIPGHERNEALDCRNYAMAAFQVLPANLDQIDRRLKAAKGQRVEQPEAIFPAVRRSTKRAKSRPKYDDW